MRKTCAALLVVSLLSACGPDGGSPHFSSSSSNVEYEPEIVLDAAIVYDGTPEPITPDDAITAEVPVQEPTEPVVYEEWQIVGEDSYAWLPDSDSFASDALSTACRAQSLLAESDESAMTADCTSYVSTMAPRSITLRKLLLRFLKNKWSKLIKSSDEAVAKAANKMLTNPGLKKEAAEALTKAMKANPESATKGFKAFMGWVRQQGSRKIALGVIGLVIVSGGLPYVLNELMDALKFHLAGIESQATKVKNLEKKVEELEKKLEERKKQCSDLAAAQPTGDGSDGNYVSTATASCSMEEDLLYNELKLYTLALLQEIEAYKKLEAEVDAELDELEAALEGFGLAEIEPDPAQ